MPNLSRFTLCLLVMSAPFIVVADDDIALLAALDRAMQKTFIDKDVETFKRLVAEDYTLVLSSGAMLDRSAVLADFTPGVHYEINASEIVSIRTFGDTAIVIADLHQKGTDHGKAFEHRVRYTDTWHRENGQWRNVAAHVSRAP